MHILMLATDAHGGFGGIAQYNRDILEALGEISGVASVTVLPRTIGEPLTGVPAKVRYDTAAARGSLAYVRRCLAHAFARAPIDAVYCAHVNLLPWARLIATVRRAPLILAIYGIDAWQPPRSPARRLAARSADLVLSISRITLGRFHAWAGASAPSAVLPNAIHLDQFGEGARNPEMEQAWGLAGRKVLLTFGRMSADERYKGFDEVIEVLPRLREQVPGLVYLAAGDGSDRARLEAKAASLGVADMVVFTGRVDEERKPDLYRLADAYVMPSSGEGFGFVVLEALAAGIPVVASTADGTCEAVRDGELGLVIDPTDAEALTAAILETLDKPKGVPEGLAYFSAGEFARRLQGALTLIATK